MALSTRRDAGLNPRKFKWQKYYQQAQVIAGDFLQIRQFMPDDLTGKIVVTNTTTAKNVEELKANATCISWSRSRRGWKDAVSALT